MSEWSKNEDLRRCVDWLARDPCLERVGAGVGAEGSGGGATGASPASKKLSPISCVHKCLRFIYSSFHGFLARVNVTGGIIYHLVHVVAIVFKIKEHTIQILENTQSNKGQSK